MRKPGNQLSLSGQIPSQCTPFKETILTITVLLSKMTEKCPRKSVFICGNLFLIIEKNPRAFEIINPIKRSKISTLIKELKN